ncbi:MAG: MBL fold metallo-hydrolase [Lachnospiraceae bacterium]|nr:MBL fold metallo-hydrolase [Lachnospiraceae bacterium]
MNLYQLHYCKTNTYLLESDLGRILFDTGWAGTFDAFLREAGSLKISVQSIDALFISHFHPDHMGIAQQIADLGPQIVILDMQASFLHASDSIFAKDPTLSFVPIRDDAVRILSPTQSRDFLSTLGFEGELLSTPGHSDDSISLCLDSGECFVGDLNPLYELPLHQGTQIEGSWEALLSRRPGAIYYGHARPYFCGSQKTVPPEDTTVNVDTRDDRANSLPPENTTGTADAHPAKDDHNLYLLVSRIMRGIDKRYSMEKIQRKTGADPRLIEDVTRMYLTHQNVGVQGILDRIEIKNR